jgi:hypothetical protein
MTDDIQDDWGDLKPNPASVEVLTDLEAEAPRDTELADDWDTLKPLTGLLASKPKEELAQLVMDLCDNKVFTSAHLTTEDQENMTPMVFMPLALGGLASLPKREVEQVGLIYEYLDKAGTRGVNGYPCFFSMRVLNKEDWKKVHRACLNEMQRREASKASLMNDL